MNESFNHHHYDHHQESLHSKKHNQLQKKKYSGR